MVILDLIIVIVHIVRIAAIRVGVGIGLLDRFHTRLGIEMDLDAMQAALIEHIRRVSIDGFHPSWEKDHGVAHRMVRVPPLGPAELMELLHIPTDGAAELLDLIARALAAFDLGSGLEATAELDRELAQLPLGIGVGSFDLLAGGALDSDRLPSQPRPRPASRLLRARALTSPGGTPRSA